MRHWHLPTATHEPMGTSSRGAACLSGGSAPSPTRAHCFARGGVELLRFPPTGSRDGTDEEARSPGRTRVAPCAVRCGDLDGPATSRAPGGASVKMVLKPAPTGELAGDPAGEVAGDAERDPVAANRPMFARAGCRSLAQATGEAWADTSRFARSCSPASLLNLASLLVPVSRLLETTDGFERPVLGDPRETNGDECRTEATARPTQTLSGLAVL